MTEAVAIADQAAIQRVLRQARADRAASIRAGAVAFSAAIKRLFGVPTVAAHKGATA